MIKQHRSATSPNAKPASTTAGRTCMPATVDPAAMAAPKPASDKPKTSPKTSPKTGPGKSEAKGSELGGQIGTKLKSMFEDVLAEPVPEKFRQLLEELGRKSDKS